MIYLIPTLAPVPAVEQQRANGQMGDDDERIAFGANVKLARKRLSLTQAQFAEQVGTTQTYISRVEKGQIQITIDTMARIAKVLNMPLHELVRPPD